MSTLACSVTQNRGILGNGIIRSVIAGVRFLQRAIILDFWHSLAIDDIVCAFLQLYP